MKESLRRTPHGFFFRNLSSLKLNGSRVRKRADTPDYKTEVTGEDAIAVQHDGVETGRISLIRLLMTSRSSHIVAVSDEDGYVSLFDTRKKLHASVSLLDNADEARIGVGCSSKCYIRHILDQD